ncbi:MAG: phosphoribosylamine--glycine ligase [Candidatus Aenigmarchaeota archaeon]|nr:phosphoribosylamine--glycine ligase [Candidatus Aenigmarchaeota archaeon]
MGMDVLLVGGDARTHALGWKIAQSPLVGKVLFANGNAGTEELGENLDIELTPKGVADCVEERDIGLTVVGPEKLICEGVIDELNFRDLAGYGPSRMAAELEGSKVWAAGFLQRHRVPAPITLGVYSNGGNNGYVNYKGGMDDAIEHINGLFDFVRMVVKADGLCEGKGVYVPDTRQEALEAVYACMRDKVFGKAGETIILQELLEGDETSHFAITDGKHSRRLASSEDYKRVGEGDTGPNTGGMGCVSPSLVVSDVDVAEIEESIVLPTISGMAAEGRTYRGTLYGGFMKTQKGKKKVLEFNARFGDPETEVLMPRLKSDIVPYLHAAAVGSLAPLPEPEWDPRYCVYIVLASGWYPGKKPDGYEVPIKGLDEVSRMKDTYVFHAGTKKGKDGIYATGGRVVGVAALADGLLDAQCMAIEAADRIDYPRKKFRRDIGHRSMRILQQR